MAYLEGDFFFIGKFSPRIFGDEVETMQVDCLPVLRFRVVAVGDVDDVALDILLDDEPRTAAQAQSFPLADGMEPIAVVLALPVSSSTIFPTRLPR